MSKQISIDWPPWESMINPSFVPLVDNHDRYLILYGGRGSSKSNAIAKILIYRCLTEPYFRFILTRRFYNTIRNSQFQTLKDLIQTLGLGPLFEFRTQPFEIRCNNGNMFISAGCDEPQKIKSVKDPTGVWYEEDVIDEDSWITITTSIRTTKARYLQEIFTINPEVEGDYRENWFFKRFFASWYKDDVGDRVLSNSDVSTVMFGDRPVHLTYTVHHSDHTDNMWLPDEFRAFLSKMRTENPYYYQIYCLGRWGNKVIGGRFYNDFDRNRHVMQIDRPHFKKYNRYSGYNPERSIHVSFDFNVLPYMAIVVAQINGNTMYVLDAIAAKDPHNSTPAACRLLAKKYKGHAAKLYIYGDPSGRAESTKLRQGQNEYSLIRKALDEFRVEVRVDRQAPGVEMRGNFINEIFKNNWGGLRIIVSDKAQLMVDELSYLQAASDGTKHKNRVTEKASGRRYEERGHFSDALDYMICKVWKDAWRSYKRGDQYAMGFEYIMSKNTPFANPFMK